MKRKLDPWRALPGDDRWLLAALVVLLPAIGAALRLLGFRRTCRLLGGSTGPTAAHTPVNAQSHALATRLGRLVSVASRHGPYGATCLRRALALRWLLRRRGLPAVLRVGVGKDDGRMRAHAWVELADRVIDDRPAIVAEYAAYRALDRHLARALRPS